MTNLPNARDYTLNPGDPVPSLLLNTLQDLFIAEHTQKTMPLPIGVDGNGVPIDVTLLVASGYQRQIVLPIGATLVGARATIKDSATGPTKWQLVLGLNDPAGGTVIASIVTGAQSSGSGTQQTISVSGAASDPRSVIATGKTYWVFLFGATGTANGHLYAWELDYIPAP